MNSNFQLNSSKMRDQGNEFNIVSIKIVDNKVKRRFSLLGILFAHLFCFLLLLRNPFVHALTQNMDLFLIENY